MAGSGIVFLIVNLSRLPVLFLVNVRTFPRREFAAISLAHPGDLPVQALLPAFLARGFPRRHLATADSLRNATLLILPPLPYFTFAIGGSPSVVLVLVNLLGNVILLAVQLGVIGSGQMASISRAHLAFIAIEISLPALQIFRLACRELPAVNAIGDPILLVLLALCDGPVRNCASGLRGVRLRKRGRNRQYEY